MQQVQTITESKFYNQLRSAVDETKAADFSLYLAMLTTDATEFDQFKLPSSTHNMDSTGIERHFNVVIKDLTGVANPERSLADNNLVNSGGYKDVVLKGYLKPNPLIETVTTPAVSGLPPELFSTLDLNTQARLLREQETKETEIAGSKPANIHSVERPNSMDIENWFSVLNEARSLDLVS